MRILAPIESMEQMMNWNESRLSRRPHSGPRTVLAEYNNEISKDGDWLHPTKGLRHISAKRAKAIAEVAEIKSRRFPTPNDYKPPRYMPHQGKRECARRVRQMEANS